MAAKAHRNQLRKGSDVPYITHVVHVATILMHYGFEEEVVLAGLLHDVVEDCEVTPEEIAQAFGDEVARIVEAMTKPAGMSWEGARAAIVAQLETGGPSVAAVKAADALHNIQSILHDMQAVGPAVWDRFNRGAEPTLQYYRSVLAGVRSWLARHPLTDELDRAVREIEAAIRTT